MQNDIYDLVLLTDILRWYGHELVHDVAEQANISARVVLNLGHQSSDRAFMLEECWFNFKNETPERTLCMSSRSMTIICWSRFATRC
jgi:hypothetical protein